MVSKEIKTLGVIPARYASRRFPGKLLQQIDGVSILERVVKRAQMARQVDQLVVISGDQNIIDVAKELNVEVVESTGQYFCGTDRCASVLPKFVDFDIVLNIQADQPFLNPEHVDILISNLVENDSIEIASLMSEKSCSNESIDVVKVVVDKDNFAIKFTRKLPEDTASFEHIGVYAFRRDVLRKIAQLDRTPNEIQHSLEQLRWMDRGYDIKMIPVKYAGKSLNTPKDLEEISAKFFQR